MTAILKLFEVILMKFSTVYAIIMLFFSSFHHTFSS